MNFLLGNLGLDNVSADPNDIPDGKYEGVCTRSEYVVIKDDNGGALKHAITYKVQSADEYNGAEKQQWYTLGTNPVDENGNFPEKVSDVRGYQPTMTEQNKKWYKKLLVDVGGVPEHMVSQTGPEVLVGKHVTFGVKTKNGYKNVSFVEPRTPVGAVVPGAPVMNQTPGFAPTAPVQAQSTIPQAGPPPF